MPATLAKMRQLWRRNNRVEPRPHNRSAIVNMVWPRMPQDPWYGNSGMLVTAVSVILLGAIYMLAARPFDHGHAPAGDAHLLSDE